MPILKNYFHLVLGFVPCLLSFSSFPFEILLDMTFWVHGVSVRFANRRATYIKSLWKESSRFCHRYESLSCRYIFDTCWRKPWHLLKLQTRILKLCHEILDAANFRVPSEFILEREHLESKRWAVNQQVPEHKHCHLDLLVLEFVTEALRVPKRRMKVGHRAFEFVKYCGNPANQWSPKDWEIGILGWHGRS